MVAFGLSISERANGHLHQAAAAVQTTSEEVNPDAGLNNVASISCKWGSTTPKLVFSRSKRGDLVPNFLVDNLGEAMHTRV